MQKEVETAKTISWQDNKKSGDEKDDGQQGRTTKGVMNTVESKEKSPSATSEQVHNNSDEGTKLSELGLSSTNNDNDDHQQEEEGRRQGHPKRKTRIDLKTLKAMRGAVKDARHKRRRCRDHNPRLWSFCINILLPLWILIFIALLFGKALAKLEKPLEVQANDEIMINRYLLGVVDINNITDSLVELPVRCYQSFFLDRFQGWIDDKWGNDTFVLPTNITNVGLSEEVKSELDNATVVAIEMGVMPPKAIPDEQLDVLLNIFLRENNLDLTEEEFVQFLKDLNEHMEQCGQNAGKIVDVLLEVKNSGNIEAAAQDLTFNWMRCWNTTTLGALEVSRPTDEQIEAARNQAPFYEDSWYANQSALFDEYLEELTPEDGNITLEDYADALERSLMDATGDVQCVPNSSGTAWFWFTVMTTVGYGNQAPVSAGGRALVSCIGFLSIILFAGILTNAGSIMGVIWDDYMFRIKRFKWTSSPYFGAFVWGWITVGWIFYLGNRAARFWTDRLGPDNFEFERWDPLWFAYITTTTVGLGDYYLPPEVVFAEDVFSFSFTVLIAFVFWATFLGQLLAVSNLYFPRDDAGERLKRNLAQTGTLYHLGDLQEMLNDAVNNAEDDDDSDSDDDDGQPSTIETLQKLVKEQQKRDERESALLSLDPSYLENEEEILEELWKLSKARQLKVLQKEEMLLRKLIEQNNEQQERRIVEEEKGKQEDHEDGEEIVKGHGADSIGISSPREGQHEDEKRSGEATPTKVLLTGDLIGDQTV